MMHLHEAKMTRCTIWNGHRYLLVRRPPHLVVLRKQSITAAVSRNKFKDVERDVLPDGSPNTPVRCPLLKMLILERRIT
eukprot:365228-Chlamydomonas_euryale.AAC.25